jgi:hypothetical protein
MVDLIKQALLNEKRITNYVTYSGGNKSVNGLSKSIDNNNTFSLSDRLLINNFLLHIGEKDLDILLKNNSDDLRKKLLFAEINIRSSKNENILKYLNDSINLSSWVAYLSITNKDDIINVLSQAYYNSELLKDLTQTLAEDVIYQYVKNGLSKYRSRVKTVDQPYILLCDSALNICDEIDKSLNLKDIFNKKIEQIENIISSYRINIVKDGLKNLYLLDGIKELKTR